jgi:uncharacterized repeat protein (TIGR03803 family)
MPWIAFALQETENVLKFPPTQKNTERRKKPANHNMSLAKIFVLSRAALWGALNAQAQDTIVAAVATFYGTNGGSPYASLTLGNDGNLYGTTGSGGPSGDGTVFELNTNNTFHPLASFAGTNGSFPPAGLLLSTNGNFYGVTYVGGLYGQGTVFEFTTNHNLLSLFSFNGTNGSLPWGGLIQASNGNFYGTTSSGGLGFANGFGGNGTIFMMSPGGLFSNLYSFSGGNDGATPYGTLVQGTNGNLYGTTYSGGSSSAGVVFEWTLDPSEMPVVQFSGANGSGPGAGLAVGCDGNLYGTTAGGGPKDAGTLFRMTYSGVVTPLHYFTETGSDGGTPYSPLLRCGRDFYGTTYSGGTYGKGTIFRVSLTTNPTPCFETVYSFQNSVDGGFPEGGLTADVRGNLYGTTTDSGTAQGAAYEVIKLPHLSHASLVNGIFSANCWEAQPGLTYQARQSFTLLPGSWSPWGPPVTANSNKVVFSGSALASHGFFSVQLLLNGQVP